MQNFKNIDFSSLFENVIVNEDIKASIENQKGNYITNTTKQVVKHSIYGNISYIISGWNNSSKYNVWINTPNSSKMILEDITLNEAIEQVNSMRVKV